MPMKLIEMKLTHVIKKISKIFKFNGYYLSIYIILLYVISKQFNFLLLS